MGMSADTKQRFIDSIHDDPAGFFINQFKKDGAFANSPRSIYELNENPIIMQVKDTGDIRLEVTLWDVNCGSYISFVDRAHAAVTGDGIEWQDCEIATRAYTWRFVEEDDIWPIMVGDATSVWEDVLTRLNICRNVRVYAWFFPLGPKAARKQPGLIMYANNQQKEA